MNDECCMYCGNTKIYKRISHEDFTQKPSVKSEHLMCWCCYKHHSETLMELARRHGVAYTADLEEEMRTWLRLPDYKRCEEANSYE